MPPERDRYPRDPREEPPWEDLDPGIRRVVSALWDEGLVTIASCQGHGHEDAWVSILVTDRANPISEVGHVTGVLAVRGWWRHSIVSLCFAPTERGTTPETWIEVRWWGEVPFR